LLVLPVLLAILQLLLPPGFLATSPAPAYALGVNISNNSGNSILPKIAVSEDGESIYLVWQDASTENNEILFASSQDEGESFGEPINISNSEGSSSSPQVAASGDNIFVVWQESGAANDVFLAFSADGGSTFSEPVNVSNTTEDFSTSPQVALSEDSVSVVWQEDSSENLEVLFASGDIADPDFEQVVNVSNTTDDSVSPQIALSDDGSIFVAWQESAPSSSDIFLASISSGAGNFTEPINVSNIGEGVASSPRMVATGGSIYLVWQRFAEGNSDVFFASSSDAITFNVTNISENEGASVSSSLITDGSQDIIYITWADNTDTAGAFDVFFSSSSDGGSSFSDPANVSLNEGQSTLPQVHLISGTETVYLTWMDNSLDISNSEIMLGASPDGGETFGCAINVSNNPTTSSTPQLVLAPGSETVHVAWQDLIEPGNFEVLLDSGLVPAQTSMTIDTVNNTSPRWDLDHVEVSGTVGSGAIATDTVTVNWGDGTATEDIPVSGCAWGPASHPYNSSALATNPNQVSAVLVAANGTQKAAASPTEVTVQKHATTLTLESISSVIEGSDIDVTGNLADSDANQGIGGMNVTFSGSGADGILELATTDSGPDKGGFATSGTIPNATSTLNSVQAHFAGDDIYEASDSAVRTFDVVSESAVRINVTTADPVADIEDLLTFNATVEFENLVSDGFIFVSECESPASERYTPLDLCLNISPAVEMAEGSNASVTISFDGKLPEGSSPDQVDIFHEELTSDGAAIVDITAARDTAADTVTGKTTTFSRFVAGLALHDPEPAGAHRTQVFLGDGNLAQLRDIADLSNSSATASAAFDKSSYQLSEDAFLTIADSNGDVESGKNDIVVAGVKSESSDPDILTITLTENGTSTGIFIGNFSFTNDVTSSDAGVLQAGPEEELSVHYISGARAQVAIEGVTEAGVVQVSDFIVDEGACLKPIGGAVDVELVDARLGAQGLVTVTIGYSNADLRGFNPASFKVVHRDDATWMDVTLPAGVDADAMTVTGQANTTGPFSIAVDVDDCSGGAGGGIGRPGAGLVVDFVASIARPPPSTSGGGSGGGGGGGGGGSSSGTVTAPQTGGSGTVPAGEDNEIVVTVPPSRGGSGGSSGIGVSEVKLAFQNVTTGGSIDVVTETPGVISHLFDSSEGFHAAVELDGANYTTVGASYDIKSSSQLAFEGVIDVTIPYDPNLIASAGNDLAETDVRFLHYNGSAWEDLTIGLNTTTNTVTGRMNGLSPVIAAIIDDGTFGPAYLEINPLAKMSVTTDEGVTAMQNVARGQELSISATLKNAQRTSQSYVYIVEIFSPSGHVESILLESGQLERGESIAISTSWQTEERQPIGTYEIKMLVLSSLEQPFVLGEVATANFDVLISQPT
jgi:hypothetical protein